MNGEPPAAQPRLPGIAASPRITDNLFFAVHPAPAAAAQATRLARQLCAEHALPATPFEAQRLHVTLRFLGGFAGLPDDLVERACRAAAGLAARPFVVAFDRVASFGRGARRPLVLRGDADGGAVAAFAARLDAALEEAGIPRDEAHPYVPHMTLLYADRAIAEQPAAPVRWVADEFVLVRSLVGRGRHLVLARWPLR